LVNGTCKACPERTVVGELLHNCIPVDCEEGEIMAEGDTTQGSEDSWCEECPDYTKPNENATICVDPGCPADSKKTKTGECEQCAEYYGPTDDQKDCYQEICLAEDNKVLGTNGKCKICPAFKHPDLTGKLCVSDPCTGNKILKEDGKCYPCDAGTRPDETGRECKKDSCDLLTQYHDDLGYCKTC